MERKEIYLYLNATLKRPITRQVGKRIYKSEAEE